MKAKYLFLLPFLLLASCATFKKELIQKGGQKEAVENAILDFTNRKKLYEKDRVFSVSVHNKFYKMVLKELDNRNSEWVKGELYENILTVSISASYHKIIYTDSMRIGQKAVKVPTRFLEKNDKLFYWWDDNYPLTQEALNIFRKYNLLVKDDLDGVIEFYDVAVDDTQKGMDYYFCKNNLKNYVAVTTSKGLGYYDPPKLDCNPSWR
jgi:hypothetical protein